MRMFVAATCALLCGLASISSGQVREPLVPPRPPGAAVDGIVAGTGDAVPPDWRAGYALGPRDRIAVSVFGQVPLSGQYVVDAAGAIMFPLLGSVPASGLTPAELADSLIRRLAAGYLRNPMVTVALEAARSRRVFVVGAVRSPGAYHLDGPVRLLEVLALAGSATSDAYGQVVLSRRDAAGVPLVDGIEELAGQLRDGLPPGRRLNLDALQAGGAGADIVLRDGDLVYVRPAGRVFVRGQVEAPGQYPLRLGMTVRQLIASAGGFTAFAAAGRIHIERAGPSYPRLACRDHTVAYRPRLPAARARYRSCRYPLVLIGFVPVRRAWVSVSAPSRGCSPLSGIREGALSALSGNVALL